jgi:phosphonate transport system ATP-binding protein
MLALEGLAKRYGATRAVEHVELTIPTGQFVGIIGRSGAGKSSLLRMINRLSEPSEGRVRWNGQDVTALRGRELRDWRRRCAMIFQQFNLVGRLDVLTNVLMGRLGHAPAWRAMLGQWSAEDRAMAFAALESLDMGAFAARRAAQLSGGQQQRVAICRALLQEPELILADEPVASLDPRNARVVMDCLARVNRAFGLTVIVNIHALDLARAYCARLIGMADGQVVFDGAPAALDAAAARELYGMQENSPISESMPAPTSGDMAAAFSAT